MHRYTSKGTGLGRLALAMALAAGLLVGPAQADTLAPLDPPQTVRMAYVPIMKFAAAYVAEDRGLFEKYGLDVELEPVRSGTEAIAFLDQGAIDVGGIAIVTSLWNGWERGMDLRIFAPGALEPLEDSPTKLILRKALADDGSVSSVADLRGRRVATAGGPGSGGEYLLAKALERGGLTIRDVEALNVANPDMALALENGSVDAAIAGSPYADQMIDSGHGVVLEADLTPGLMTVAFVGSSRFLDERPEAAERFVLALAEATRLMQGEDYLARENIDAYLKYAPSTEEAIRAGSPVVYDPNVEISIEGLADVERVHRENGRTEYDQPLDISTVVDNRFVEKAIEVLGAN